MCAIFDHKSRIRIKERPTIAKMREFTFKQCFNHLLCHIPIYRVYEYGHAQQNCRVIGHER